ncbi:MAG: sigma-70 family RNA polymerase sigma factor [Alphaproteobacteria bacterium]|nr:sigma-70 family RNA polymerase sigma factor [Alphaproteobacteria bacterium]
MLAICLAYIDTAEQKTRFEQFYRKYERLVLWRAGSRLHNASDAEDCAQEVFIYFAKNFAKIEEIGSTRTKNFVLTVTDGYAINFYKKRTKERETAVKTIEEDCFCEYAAGEISGFIQMLDEDDRNLLYLHHGYGLTTKEIADMYKITDGAVRKRLYTARKKLKKLLEEEDECNP